MKKNKKDLLIIGVILILFLITRLYKIGEIPSSLYWDETSIGYNAYSILQTGKDEWGVFLPIHFKAFGEYKLPIQIYLTAFSIKLFGLNEAAVRIPAVFFALLCIIITYFIARKISNNNFIALLSAFFLSISPYFFIFSRTGYEAVPGLMFFLLGILLFLYSRQKPLFFLLSGLLFAMSTYAYNGYRILSPLVFFSLSAVQLYAYHQQIKKIIIILAALSLFILASYPVIQFLIKSSGSRYQAIGIENLERKKISVGLDIAKNYLSHFNLTYLFINGDSNPRSQQPGFGQLYIYDLLLLLFGIIYLRGKPLILKLPVLFILLGFLPASVTRESPHALRSLSVIPFICIVSSYGVIFLQNKFLASRQLILQLVIIVYLGLFLVYVNNFVEIYSLTSAKDWQEGYKLIFQKYKEEFNNYDHILISDRYSQPYIYALFYLQYNPDDFRSTVIYNQDIKKATSVVKSFDKFIFTNIDYHQLPVGKTLIFSHPTDRLNELSVSNIIYHSDGSIAFYVYESKK